MEWATTGPPPRHNFTELPRIRSAFELHYPRMAARMRAEAHIGGNGHLAAPDEITAQPCSEATRAVPDPRDK